MGFQLHLSQKVFILFCLAAILLFFGLGSAPIYILDEAKNAQCAREMWYNNDPVVPTFNGQLRTDKPPLHYWFMGLAYSIAGVGPAQARFFSVIMGLFTLFITFKVVKKYAGVQIGFYSILALTLSPHFLFEFRLAVPDPYLIAFTTAGLWAGFQYFEGKRGTALFATGFFLGLATLSKGPVALVLPGLIFLLYMLLTKQWHPLKDYRVFLALFVAIAVAVPWFLLVHKQTGGSFTKGFFIEHNLERFSSEKEGHGGPFFVTPLMVLIGLLPLSLFTVYSLKKKHGFWQQRIFLFSALVTGVYVVFFSLSNTKLPNYPMPCYPFAAVMAAFALERIISKAAPLPPFIRWCWLIISICFPIAAYFGIWYEETVRQLAWVGLLLIILTFGSTWIFFKCKNGDCNFLPILTSAWLLFSIIFLWVGYPLIYKENPVAKLIPIAEKSKGIVAYKMYNPAFNFNLKRPKDHIPVMGHTDSLKNWFYTKSQEDLMGCIVLSRKEYAAELESAGFEKVAESKDLFELPVTVIFKKLPE
jgi:4-amino-4-deoxy-L-arabinose transferase-like glycosyltransferase